jgi:hypothetical protein
MLLRVCRFAAIFGFAASCSPLSLTLQRTEDITAPSLLFALAHSGALRRL